jgi:RNA polymerase subunit RPABC4/transcription elongation factor Spt4
MDKYQVACMATAPRMEGDSYSQCQRAINHDDEHYDLDHERKFTADWRGMSIGRGAIPQTLACDGCGTVYVGTFHNHNLCPACLGSTDLY